MSPLKGILVYTRGRASAGAGRGAAACAAFLIAFTFAFREAVAWAPADAASAHDADARRAEKVLAKLRQLHEAADADDGEAYRALASKFYPELFARVAEIRAGDLSTDLSTAVFLSERLARTWAAAGGEAICQNERPDIYAPLCVELRGGTVRRLLLAKSRLHARWAEAVLKGGRGEADAASARALAEMKAARANDALIAARVVETPRRLETMPRSSGEDRRGRFGASGDGDDGSFARALREAAALLAWMPRGATFNQLSNARQAYADGLWWRGRARGAQSLVVSANGFAPDPLKEMRLDAAQLSAAAASNWRSAGRYTRLAEQSLSRPAR